jgi:hypothetical protein
MCLASEERHVASTTKATLETKGKAAVVAQLQHTDQPHTRPEQEPKQLHHQHQDAHFRHQWKPSPWDRDNPFQVCNQKQQLRKLPSKSRYIQILDICRPTLATTEFCKDIVRTACAWDSCMWVFWELPYLFASHQWHAVASASALRLSWEPLMHLMDLWLGG